MVGQPKTATLRKWRSAVRECKGQNRLKVTGVTGSTSLGRKLRWSDSVALSVAKRAERPVCSLSASTVAKPHVARAADPIREAQKVELVLATL